MDKYNKIITEFKRLTEPNQNKRYDIKEFKKLYEDILGHPFYLMKEEETIENIIRRANKIRTKMAKSKKLT